MSQRELCVDDHSSGLRRRGHVGRRRACSPAAPGKGSVGEVANHGVGQQPAPVGEDGAAGVVGARLEQAVRDRVARPGARPVGDSAASGRPSRSRRPSMIVSSARSASSSSSASCAGARPAASRSAYAAGCLTFHQRRPPTWLCAPGPTPHQLASAQYSSLCRQRAASEVAQLETSYQSNPAARRVASAAS